MPGGPSIPGLIMRITLYRNPMAEPKPVLLARRHPLKFGTKFLKLALGVLAVSSFLLAGVTANAATHAQATGAKQPNILVIMGDDIGMWNIGAYHRGMMAG